MRTACFVALLLTPAASAGPRLPDAKPADVGLDADRLALIDDAVKEALDGDKCKGAVVLVARRGKVAYRKAFGHRAVEPKAEPMTADTVFDLASLTKPITAACILHLIQTGRLKLDDPVSKHLPAFADGKVTLSHLLLHVSGLPAGNPVAAYENGREKAVKAIGELRPKGAPGERFVYSDLGYVLLGEVVAKASGERLDAYAKKHLFDPLGLADTAFVPGEKLRARCAPTEKVKGEWLRGVVHDPRARALGGVAGHAGLFGTADELAVFAQMLLDDGTFGEKRILDAATARLYTEARDVPGGKRTLGWDARTAYSGNRGEKFDGFGHTGFTGTSVWIDPATKAVVVVLTNRVHPDGKGDVRRLRSRTATLAALACR